MATLPNIRSIFGFATAAETNKNPPKTKEIGAPGFSVYGGFISEKNTNDLVSGSTKWQLSLIHI